MLWWLRHLLPPVVASGRQAGAGEPVSSEDLGSQLARARQIRWRWELVACVGHSRNGCGLHQGGWLTWRACCSGAAFFVGGLGWPDL